MEGGDGSTSTEKRRRRHRLGFRLRRKKQVELPPAAAVVPTMSAPREEQQGQVVPAAAKSRTIPSSSSSWLCRTRRFQQMCDWAFDVIDTDQSGSVDEKELYSGLLLIHLKLGTYTGPAACRPLGREKCRAVFEQFDVDQSGTLDREEFREAMMLLFSNVALRVLTQWSMTLMIVPLVAQRIVDGLGWIAYGVITGIENLDEYSDLADFVEVSIENTRDLLLSFVPASIYTMLDSLQEVLAKVPDSVWNSIPLTLVSTILGVLVVPWMIFQIDDFFQALAQKRAVQQHDKES